MTQKSFYIFYGMGGCETCKTRTGYYNVYPGRPHDFCKCPIVEVQNKPCLGEFSAAPVIDPNTGSAYYKDIGGGRYVVDWMISLSQPDGNIETEIISIELPWPSANFGVSETFEAIEQACRYHAEQQSKCMLV